MANYTELNQEAIKRNVTKLVNTQFDNFSTLGTLGATYEDYETDEIRSFSSAGSVSLKEGEKKTTTGVIENNVHLVNGKTISNVIFTEEALLKADTASVVKAVSTDLAAAVMQGLDMGVLLGKNTSDGSDITWLQDIALAKNGLALPSTASALDDFDAAIAHAGIDAQVALSTQGYTNLARKRTTTGALLYPNISPEGRFVIDGIPAVRNKGLGFDNYVKLRDRADLIENGIQSVTGDFSKIHIAVADFKIRTSREGTYDGTNLLEENKLLVLAEVFWKVGFSGDIASNFAITKGADFIDPEVDPDEEG